jgi:hypothetical protein
MATLKFGAKAPAAKSAIVEDKPKSQLWVNVGYSIEVEGEASVCIYSNGYSMWIAIKELPTNTRNSEYNYVEPST